VIARLGLFISRVFRRTAPDPFVLAILLTGVAAVVVLLAGDLGPARGPARVVALFDAWRGSAGLWKLLEFAMQMCLVLVSGHALAASPPAARAIARLSALPRSTRQAAALVALVACLTAVFNWGLCLIAGALLARETGRSLAARGVRAHYPLLCAAGYLGFLVWHGGLSGSAPLTMTSAAEAARVLPAATAGRLGAGIPLAETTFSPLNLFVTAGLLVLLPALMALLAPSREEDLLPIGSFRPAPVARPVDRESVPATIPDRLDRSRALALMLGVLFLLVPLRQAFVAGAGALDLKAVIAGMVGLGLVLHGAPRAYLGAVEEGASACGGIILQFPLYAGIMGMLEASGLVSRLAGPLSGGSAWTAPVVAFFVGCVVNLFIPSGGGHWAVQGPVALESGLRAGVEPGKMVMAVAYGGEVTDMLQPFWALPLLAITGVRARDIVGYTAVAMVAAAAWMLLGLVVF
jgi:short-chain fatty acids transporter